MKLTVSAVLAFMMAGGCLAANAHIGTWKFNEAKSKMPDGMGKYSTVIYSEQGDKIKVTTDGTDTDGKPKHSVWVGKFDGKAYPVKGSPSYNAVGLRVINGHANFVQALKNGKVMWWGTITISKNGKTRTASLHWTDANGKKFSAKKVYDRT
jgi:hypothetical protein